MKQSKIENKLDRLLAIDFINTALINESQCISVSDRSIALSYQANRYGISHKRNGKFKSYNILAMCVDCLGNPAILTTDRTVLQLTN